MKFKLNKRNICLTAVAVLAIASISVGSAMAYFSTYVVSKGAQEITLDFSETEIDEKVQPGLKIITVKNVGEAECFVRVRVIAGAEHMDKWFVDLANSRNWKAGDGGYYYYCDSKGEKMLEPGSATSELKIAIEDFTEEFNVIVIQENTPALYDENGEAYADWNRNELIATDKFGVPVSVNRMEEE